MLFIPLFIGCKHRNTTCKSGDNFVNDGCLQDCTCYDDFVCSPLCVDEPLAECLIGYSIEKYRNPINGTKCFVKEGDVSKVSNLNKSLCISMQDLKSEK